MLYLNILVVGKSLFGRIFLYFQCFTATGTIVGMLRDSEPASNAVRMKNIRTRYITICDVATVLVIAIFGVLSVPFKMRRFVKMVEIWNIVRSFT